MTHSHSHGSSSLGGHQHPHEPKPDFVELCLAETRLPRQHLQLGAWGGAGFESAPPAERLGGSGEDSGGLTGGGRVGFEPAPPAESLGAGISGGREGG